MAALPYPAAVVTHTFQVQAANEFFLRLFELPPLDSIPPHQRSTIHFLFHPDFLNRSGEVLPIRIRHMFISISGKTSPAVSADLPVDEAAQAVYASLRNVTS